MDGAGWLITTAEGKMSPGPEESLVSKLDCFPAFELLLLELRVRPRAASLRCGRAGGGGRGGRVDGQRTDWFVSRVLLLLVADGRSEGGVAEREG